MFPFQNQRIIRLISIQKTIPYHHRSPYIPPLSFSLSPRGPARKVRPIRTHVMTSKSRVGPRDRPRRLYPSLSLSCSFSLPVGSARVQTNNRRDDFRADLIRSRQLLLRAPELYRPSVSLGFRFALCARL